MPEKIINTRIKNKQDTFANWTSENPVLLEGELAIVVIPADSGEVAQEPSILFKVGDGTSTFNALQFVSALGADVYAWAKSANKPIYLASEISGLADYVAGEIQDTNTKYKLEADANDGSKFHLYAKEVGGAFVKQDTITIAQVDVDTLVTGTANGTVSFNGTDVAVKGLGSAAYTNSTAYDSAGTATAKANAALDSAKDYVDALSAKIGTVSAGETVIGMISDVSDVVDTVGSKVTTLVGSDSNKSVRTIANEELTRQLVPSNAQASLDTLAEIAAWIQEHPEDVSEMNAAIAENTADILELEGTVGNHTDALDNKVDKVDGHRLMTPGDTGKLNAIEALAEKNRIMKIAVNGIDVPITDPTTNRVVNLTIPTGDLADKDEIAKGDLSTSLKNEIEGKVNSSICGDIISHDASEFSTSDHAHDITEIGQESGYVVFNCGSATVNI